MGGATHRGCFPQDQDKLVVAGSQVAISNSGVIPVQGTLRDWLELNSPSISKAVIRS